MTEATITSHIPDRSADDFADDRRRRLRLSYAVCAATSVLLAWVYVVAFHKASLLSALAALVPAVLLVLLWRYPKFGAYAILGSVCLFETQPLTWADSLTDRVPFFWNINTVVQHYAGVDFHALPLNVFEVFLLAALSISLFRAVYTRRVDVRVGMLFWPIAAYAAFVAWGWMYGMATGGDFKISLQEVRSQLYFLVAYLMGVNLLRDAVDLRRVQWLMVLSIGVKGILYTVRRVHYFTLAGLPLPDQGVGSHEEAFFFDAFVLLLLVFLICNVQPKLRRVMWVLLPFVVMGDLACNRRAATAALIVAIPILLLAAYRALPNRRRLIGSIGLAIVACFSIYYPIFKDRSGALAQPARAIRSQFDPDPRDRSSNDYRVAEDADLYATIKSSPLTGYGYGKRMIHAVPIADISKAYAWWDIMTHDQILWVWMRVGTIGFVVFWLMISAIVIASARVVINTQSTSPQPFPPGREPINSTSPTPSFRGESLSSPEVGAAALFGMLVVSTLLIFGLLDLQLSNFRDMLFAGFWSAIPAVTLRTRGDAR